MFRNLLADIRNKTLKVNPKISISKTSIGDGIVVLYLNEDGTVETTGNNIFNVNFTAPDGFVEIKTLINSDNDWVDIASGHNFALLVKFDGTLWSVGSNSNGRTGLNTDSGTTSLTQVGSDTDWLRVAVGKDHSLALKTDGTLYSFGNNDNAKTGLNITSGNTLVPTQVGTDTDWVDIVCGQEHSLALKEDNTLYSFGLNGNGETGQGTTAGTTDVPTQVGTDTDWVKFAASSPTSLVIKSNGTLYGFGGNNNITTPTQIETDNDWIDIAVEAEGRGVGLRANGIPYNINNNLDSATAVTFIGDTPASNITNVYGGYIGTGGFEIFIDDNERTVYQYLNPNIEPQYGLQQSTLRPFLDPQFKAVELPKIKKIPNIIFTDSTSTKNYHLMLSEDGRIISYGSGTQAFIGNSLSTATNFRFAPNRYVILNHLGNDFKDIAVSQSSNTAVSNSALFIKNDGSLWAIGSNSNGITGQGVTSGSLSELTQVGIDTNWDKVEMGGSHAIALKQDGTLWSWGSNSDGQTGQDTTTGEITVPTLVSSSSVTNEDYIDISAGFSHSLARKANSNLYGCGANPNIGEGSSGTTNVFTELENTNDILWISCAGEMSAYIKNNGLAYTAGLGEGLGEGRTTSNTFQQVVATSTDPNLRNKIISLGVNMGILVGEDNPSSSSGNEGKLSGASGDINTFSVIPTFASSTYQQIFQPEARFKNAFALGNGDGTIITSNGGALVIGESGKTYTVSLGRTFNGKNGGAFGSEIKLALEYNGV